MCLLCVIYWQPTVLKYIGVFIHLENAKYWLYNSMSNLKGCHWPRYLHNGYSKKRNNDVISSPLLILSFHRSGQHWKFLSESANKSHLRPCSTNQILEGSGHFLHLVLCECIYYHPLAPSRVVLWIIIIFQLLQLTT